MFLLTLIPLAWGYLLATSLLRESQRWLRWSLAYALGLLSFLAAQAMKGARRRFRPTDHRLSFSKEPQRAKNSG